MRARVVRSCSLRGPLQVYMCEAERCGRRFSVWLTAVFFFGMYAVMQSRFDGLEEAG